MHAFRKKFKRGRCSILAPSTPVIETQSQTIMEDDNGNVVNRVVYVPVDMTSREAEKSLPDAKDYQLDTLLSAGVPLKELQVSSYFNPTDFATNERLAASIVLPNIESTEQ